MTKYKEYLRSKGFKLDSDYPFLPYSVKGTPTLECVSTGINLNHKCVYIISHYVVGDSITCILTDGTQKHTFR